MEAYKSTCPDCGAVYYWHGYKTGLGKSKAQLEEMHRKDTVCRECGSNKLKTEVDRESELGQVFNAQEEQLAGIIGAMFQERENPNPSKPS